ncbi:hypothetical protein SDC9_154405 [bioreactor metagenome]|uniref:Uncharacterized protein n=1 Tax=bioreactor metagenome TaxID=1076179 RepID=A0A645F133_9ZZZZ
MKTGGRADAVDDRLMVQIGGVCLRPVAGHVGKGDGDRLALLSGGGDIQGASAQVAAQVGGRHGQPVEQAVVGGQGGNGERLGGVPAEVQRGAVPGDRKLALVKAAGDGVGYRGLQGAFGQGEGDRRGRQVGDGLIGGGQLIHIKDAGNRVSSAVEHIEGGNAGGSLREHGGDVFPAGEVKAGERQLGERTCGICEAGGEGVARAVAVYPAV